MTLNFLSPRTLLLLCFVLILNSSCSKDSDLLTDYVLSETEETLLNSYLVDDSFTVSRQSSLILDVLSNDNLGNQENVEIIDATEPANGTVVINDDDTITYTPDADLTEEVEDSFTYTVEVPNDDATVSTETGNVTVTVSEDSKTSLQFDYNVKDFGAKGDGVADDRVAIQAAIDAASEAGTVTDKAVLFIPSGTYRVYKYGIDNGLYMKPNIIVIGETPAANSSSTSIITIDADPVINWGQILMCMNVDNWELRNITIDGNGGNSFLGGGDKVAGNATKGVANILVQNCDNWVIDNYTGQNSWYVNVAVRDINNFEFTNNRAINMDCGILLNGGDMSNGIIEDNFMDGHQWSEPIALYGGNVDNISVQRNIIKNKSSGHAIVVGIDGYPNHVHKNITIKDNVIYKTGSGIGVLFGINSNIDIQNNSMYVTHEGIDLNNCTGCSIIGNEVDTGWGGVVGQPGGVSGETPEHPENAGINAIAVRNGSTISITDNTITQWGWNCIYQIGNTGVTETGNSCSQRL